MDPNPQLDKSEVSYTPPQAWGADESTAPVGTPSVPTPLTSIDTTTVTVTPTPVTPPAAPQPLVQSMPERSGSSLGRTFLVWLALILLGILLGVLASFALPYFTLTPSATSPLPELTPTPVIPSDSAAIQISPTVEITPIPTPTATPSSLLNLKWNMMTVKSPTSLYSTYRIYYPTTWSIKEYKNTPKANQTGSSNLILTKGLLGSINIVQSDELSPSCSFSDKPESPTIFKDTLVWRWAPSIGTSAKYLVCESKTGNNFMTATSIGLIKISGDKIDAATLDEINYILEKIIIVK